MLSEKKRKATTIAEGSTAKPEKKCFTKTDSTIKSLTSSKLK